MMAFLSRRMSNENMIEFLTIEYKNWNCWQIVGGFIKIELKIKLMINQKHFKKLIAAYQRLNNPNLWFA